MPLLVLPLLAQLTVAGAVTQPVLQFPEAGLDDPARYQGYQTRFYRDAARNTTQVYLDAREGRVVHILANAGNESIAFSARAGEAPVALHWGRRPARVGMQGRARTLTYSLEASVASVTLGWFLLGSMRVERDVLYHRLHARPFGATPYEVPELLRLVGALEQLDAPTRAAHLRLLHAPGVDALRDRLRPHLHLTPARLRIVQPSVDGRDTLSLEVRVDPRRVRLQQGGDSLSVASRDGGPVAFTITIGTTTAPLHPLRREEIFTPDFLRFVAEARRAAPDQPATRWLERQVRGVELLASREKLMAGLPTYATYFGRDMLMSALMMRPIWRPEMSEFVIGAALRKLSPSGEVSHEEALGGQAVRETANDYVPLADSARAARERGDEVRARQWLDSARVVLAGYRRPRENYHMVDDELQLPVMVARWLSDASVPDARKRAFLRDSSDGQGPRLRQLLREFAVVARMTRPYAERPTAASLIGFAPRDATRWSSSSWRDSGVGYANGRYAMDVNAIWAPEALAAIGVVLERLRALGWDAASLARLAPDALAHDALGAWVADPALLRRAEATWRDAWRLFEVRLGPAEVARAVQSRLAAMPAAERSHWEGVLARTAAPGDSLVFEALSLDASRRPIAVAHSDAATRLFLVTPDVTSPADRERVLRDVRLFTRAYPVGLMIDNIGPVVANDAFATREVWQAFVDDPYHGPRVVWGREVHLFLEGLSMTIARAEALPPGDAARDAFVAELRRAMSRVSDAVEASGFRSELWSYEFPGGTPRAVRYGSGGDIQLWSTTDLAVQFLRARTRGR